MNRDSNLTDLHHACAAGHLLEVRDLLSDDALHTVGAVNARSRLGATPLFLAASAGHDAVCDELLANGALPNIALVAGATPLYQAALRGHVSTVRLLLERCKALGVDLDVNVRSKDGSSAVYVAAQRGHSAVVRLLASARADLEVRMKKGASPGTRPLSVAAHHGHAATVAVLIERGARLDARNARGETALFVASLQGHVEVVRVLLEHGAHRKRDFNGRKPEDVAARLGHQRVVSLLQRKHELQQRTKNVSEGQHADSWTPLLTACLAGDSTKARRCLEQGADTSTTNDDGLSALHLSALKGFTTLVDVLLKHGAAVDQQRTQDGATPLFLAAQHGQAAAVEMLLEHHARPDTPRRDGLTPFCVAAQFGEVDVMATLIAAGASVDPTALHAAIRGGQPVAVEFLLDQGLSPHATTSSGVTPLHVAAAAGNLELVQLLFYHTAEVDVNACRSDGASVYLVACESREVPIRMLELFEEYGADVHRPANNGSTPLSVAARSGNAHVVSHLLNLGAHIDEPDERRWTPLHYAAARGEDDVVWLLLDRGATTGLLSREGWTPLYLASERDHRSTVRLLLEHGADHDVHEAVADVLGMIAPSHVPAVGHEHELHQHEAAPYASYEANHSRAALEALHALVDTSVDPLVQFHEQVGSVRSHMRRVLPALAQSETAVSRARKAQTHTGDALETELQRTSQELEDVRAELLDKAKQQVLPDEDLDRLKALRSARLRALTKAETLLARSKDTRAHVSSAGAQLELLLEDMPPSESTAPAELWPTSELSVLLGDLDSDMRAMTKLEESLVRHVRLATQALEKMKSLAQQSAARLEARGLAVDSPELAVASMLRSAATQHLAEIEQQQADLAGASTIRDRIAMLRLDRTAVEQAVVDVTDLPHAKDLSLLRVQVETAHQELEAQQSSLRGQIRRGQLTEQEVERREAQIVEGQERLARLRAELEEWRDSLQELARTGLPEAMHLLTSLQEAQVPPVLRMLLPTGLYRHRVLRTDYTPVAGIELQSARYQMRVVHPVGDYRPSSIKVLKAFPAAYFKQIRNEIVNLSRIDHANVLHAELVFHEPDGDFVWVQYPYMARGSMDCWLSKQLVSGELPSLLTIPGQELLRAMFREILDGVLHLHQHQVVHNDIKPANVLVNDDGVPLLCDFELSTNHDVAGTRALGSVTVGGLTLEYAAPEVRADKRSTDKSDMYSLGRLMYEMQLQEWLSEQYPNHRGSVPRGLNPRTLEWAFPEGDMVHPAFRELVSLLLSHDPDLRPSAIEARTHEYFTHVLFEEEEEEPQLPPSTVALDVAAALPEYKDWDTDGEARGHNRMRLRLNSREALGVIASFQQAGCPRRNVVAVERVENADLLRRFAFHKHQLEHKYPGQPIDERLLFHGTKPHVVGSIAEQGFDMRLNGANGTRYGKGNYFARESSYSANDTYSPPDRNGVKWMFLVRVLVGETVQGRSGMTRAERPNGALVESAVDSPANPSVFVTFDNGQAMPVYVIGFK